MYDDGYKSIWNIDYSQSCLDQMSERNVTLRPELVWTEMDITDLKYEDEFFDVIIDKSTLDCILCCPEAFLQCAKTMKECQRTLKTGGYFISISFHAPSNRLDHLMRNFLDFEISVYEIVKVHLHSDQALHYLFICKKGPNAQKKVDEEWDSEIKELTKLYKNNWYIA